MPSFGCCKVTGAGIGANLSEERFFPEPLSKDFYFVFSAMVLDSG